MGGQAKISTDNAGTAGVQILGSKVWAAQWQRVDAKYVAVKNCHDTLPNELKLLDIVSLQTVRGSEALIAEVDLDIGSGIATQDDDEEKVEEQQEEETAAGKIEDDEYWREFEREVEKIEDDFA